MNGPSSDAPQQDWRGQRLGLPETGVDSVPGFGRRFVALLIDWVPCSIVAQVATTNPATSSLSIFAALTVICLIFFGRSWGHAIMGMKVARLGEDGGLEPRITVGGTVIRTVLLCLVVPAVIYDLDGRGLHDRAVRSIVVRTR
ncbi:RDD family protein [Pseudonocardiaceae bacterium YIM PH 21723]|nr:RDD family protein [Pseudonocardiaceae bacterium YIM PH 21723]